MRGQILLFVPVFIGCGGRPVYAQPRYLNGRLSIEGGRDAEKCSDLTVRASGELARAAEEFRLTKTQAPALEVRAASHSAVHVRGWDRPDYAVEVCKFAMAPTRSAADQALRSIVVSRNGGRFSVVGPDHGVRWQAVLFVHSPKDSTMNLESGNAPIDAVGVSGKLTIRASDGPLSLDRCSGTIDGETVNGPISMNGGSGEVHLRAVSGPISLKLADQAWNGSELEARTDNGPLSLSVPAGFRSGLRLETSGHGPIICLADTCLNARSEGSRFFPRAIQTGSGDVVRLSTHNGPVSVSSPGRRSRVI